MADAVFLHVGAPKTGTSYLQTVMWHNHQLLRDHGFFLPPGARRYVFDAVCDLRGGLWARRELNSDWATLARRVRNRPGVAVVSEELLGGSPADVIERAVESLAPVPVHVVMTTRDLGRQAPAEWQQALRSRSAISYSDWLSRLADDSQPFWAVQDPVRVFERWGARLEPGRFHVVVVPPPGSPTRTLWDRFARVVGAEEVPVEAQQSRQNVSLGLAEAELLRRFNARLGDRFPLREPYVQVVRNHLLRPALFSATDRLPIGVPAEHVDWVERRGMQMVDDLRALGDRVDVVGDLDDLRPRVEPADRTAEQLSDGELLEAALDAMVRQMEAVEAAQQEEAQQEEARQEEARQEEARQEEARPDGSPRTPLDKLGDRPPDHDTSADKGIGLLGRLRQRFFSGA
jgi:hypothetical protein